jgi:inward rectifier potassium channel
LQGLDSHIAQTIHASHTYAISDLVSHARFADVLTLSPNGERIIDYTQFHAVIPQTTPSP